MTENNKRQAYLPTDALVIENPVGTAPSFVVEHKGRVVISLPGVPREMKFLMVERVVPYLREKFGLKSELIKAKVLKTAGLGESALDSMLGNALLSMANPSIGLAAHSGQVDVRITAKAEDEATADKLIEPVEAQVRAILGEYIYGVDDDKLEAVLYKRLTQKGVQLAVVEAGIGQPISQHLDKLPNWSDLIQMRKVEETLIELKRQLHFEDTIKLRDLAERAAEWAAHTQANMVALAVVSDPNVVGDHADEQGNTAIAVHYNGRTRSRLYGFGKEADVTQEWLRLWGLAVLWRILEE